MKRIITAFSSMLALAFGQGAATAAMVVPSGSTTFTGSATITVSGTSITCTATMTLLASPNNSGDTHGTYSHTNIPTGTFNISSFVLSGSTMCSMMTISSPPYYNVSIISSSTMKAMIDIKSFVPGVTCSGNVEFLLTSSSTHSTITIQNQYVDVPFSMFTCMISATMPSFTPPRILEIIP